MSPLLDFLTNGKSKKWSISPSRGRVDKYRRECSSSEINNSRGEKRGMDINSTHICGIPPIISTHTISDILLRHRPSCWFLLKKPLKIIKIWLCQISPRWDSKSSIAFPITTVYTLWIHKKGLVECAKTTHVNREWHAGPIGFSHICQSKSKETSHHPQREGWTNIIVESTSNQISTIARLKREMKSSTLYLKYKVYSDFFKQ